MLRACCLILILFSSACNLQYGEPTAFPTPDVPQVNFDHPANNDSITEGSDLEILLVAEDSGVGIARVALMIDDLPYRDSQPEVSGAVPVFTVTMNWLAQGIGYHSLTAVAYRPDGTESRPRTIVVVVTAAEDES